jgi:hypothetical protein
MHLRILKALLALAVAVTVAACGSGTASTPTPAPSPTPAPGVSTMDAFRTLIARDDLTYRSVEAGSFTVDGGPESPYRMESAVRGQDFRATVSLTRLDMELVTIGPLSWARLGDGLWVQGPRDDAVMDGILDVWQYLGYLNDLSFEGDAPNHPGGVLYKASKPIPYANRTLVGGEGAADGKITSLYLVLDGETGAPILIELNAEVAVPAASGAPAQALRMKSTIRFSDVDGPVDIAPPQ